MTHQMNLNFLIRSSLALALKAKMEEQRMKHMMQNMPMGKDSMSQCPMMKGMKDMDHTSSGPHKERQEAQK